MVKRIALSAGINSDETRLSLQLNYIEAFRRAGGVVAVFPLLENETEIRDWLDAFRVDAVVLTGGGDFSPEYYGEELTPCVKVASARRDRSDFALYSVCKSRSLPVLGICRGMQLINVAHGGTLVSDMSSILGENFAVHQQETPGNCPSHRVNLLRGSKVALLFGNTEIETNSHHHQCVDKVGDGLKVSGYSEDGIVESFESEDGLVLGVQFHPEKMAKDHNCMSEFLRKWISQI